MLLIYSTQEGFLQAHSSISIIWLYLNIYLQNKIFPCKGEPPSVLRVTYILGELNKTLFLRFCHRKKHRHNDGVLLRLERMKGIEPSTFSLGS